MTITHFEIESKGILSWILDTGYSILDKNNFDRRAIITYT